MAGATFAKLMVALLTEGSNDVGTSYRFGSCISDHGLHRPLPSALGSGHRQRPVVART